MAMGKRERDRQVPMWVPTTDLPTTAGHPFYARLNRILRDQGFDDFVEAQCASFYAERMGRPGLAPAIYFRLLLIGYFEGIDSERGIAWRAADSLTLRDFLGLALPEAPPDHSTISRTRRLIDLETHRAVFTWVLQGLGQAGLVKGKTLGIDATTLEANAALRSIVRRDTSEGYQEFLMQLAKASGIDTPTRAKGRRPGQTTRPTDHWCRRVSRVEPPSRHTSSRPAGSARGEAIVQGETVA
jgi:transposase